MHTQAQPKSIFEDLMQQLHEAHRSPDSVSQFQLKLWERDANNLQNVSQGLALEAKAQLAALRGEFDESDRLYAAALKISPDYTGSAARYLSLLSANLRPEKLLIIYRDVGSAFQGNPEATRYVEALLAGQGFLISAWKLSEELARMGSYSACEPITESERATQHLMDADLTDEELGAPVAFTKRFLLEKSIRQIEVNVVPTASDESEGSIFFQICTPQSPEAAIQTELELFDALDVESFPLERSGTVSFGLVGTQAALD